MRQLQLTLIIRDAQTATMRAQTFLRAPVRVGRHDGNHVRLDARVVSRRHGVFLFSKDGVQFIDYASANGTYIDGARIAANRPIEIRDAAVITIAPFQIVASLHLVDARRLAIDPDAATLVEAIGSASTLRSITASPAPVSRGQRAERVLAIVAEALLAAGSRTARTLSALRLAASADEMIALLLDAEHGDERLHELRELLGELLRPRLTSMP